MAILPSFELATGHRIQCLLMSKLDSPLPSTSIVSVASCSCRMQRPPSRCVPVLPREKLQHGGHAFTLPDSHPAVLVHQGAGPAMGAQALAARGARVGCRRWDRPLPRHSVSYCARSARAVNPPTGPPLGCLALGFGLTIGKRVLPKKSITIPTHVTTGQSASLSSQLHPQQGQSDIVVQLRFTTSRTP